MSVERTIVLKGFAKGHHDEGILGGVCTPGMGLRLQSDGTFLQESKAIGEAVKGGLCIAKEDALQGRTYTTAYASGERVFVYYPLPGDHIHVFVKAGANIVIGDNLVVEAGGSGLFVEAAGTEARYHLEALESSGGALAANTHIKARVLG